MAVLADPTLAVQRAFLFHFGFWDGRAAATVGVSGRCRRSAAANALNDLKDNGLLQATGYCTRNGKTQAVRWDVFVGEHP